MKYIISASYYNTGSSAITDLLREFSNVTIPEGGCEWRFLQDPDGVRALEYYLIENNHRHNTSHAIKRFMKMCEITQKRWYSKSVGDIFIQSTRRYIDNIVELKSETHWLYDNFEKPFSFRVLSKLYYMYARIVNIIRKERICTNILSLTHEMGYYTHISKEDFYKYTRQYINDIFSECEKKEYIMIDQLVPASNTMDYLNYFENNAKVIIMERDPRDVFLFAKLYGDGVMPRKVDEWCKWYEITRKHRDYETYDENKVKLVQFEDLIYKYDETLDDILKFLGIDKINHVNPKMMFNPDVSIVNTNISARFSEYSDEVAYIEKHLDRYLYNFPENPSKKVLGDSLVLFGEAGKYQKIN